MENLIHEIQSLVNTHLTHYPGMELADCIKLIYQNEMGGGHLIGDAEQFRLRFLEEMAQPSLLTAAPAGPEDIGNNLVRVHLSSLDGGPAAASFTRLCVRGAKLAQGSKQGLLEKLGILRGMALNGELPYPSLDTASRIDEYIAAGCPAAAHSSRYRSLYDPHYRILDKPAGLFLPVFAAIDKALAQKPHVLVGIDGMAGAGKSTLAAMLEEVYGCGLVHTDDFFLRPFQRGRERFAEPGGNVDYERLAPVAAQAADNRAFRYQAYDCKKKALGPWRQVPSGSLTVLEGCYSLHPKVGAACDVRVFLTVAAPLQRERIVARNGPEEAVRFVSEWIPLENRYFVEFGIREGSNVVIDTSGLSFQSRQ